MTANFSILNEHRYPSLSEPVKNHHHLWAIGLGHRLMSARKAFWDFQEGHTSSSFPFWMSCGTPRRTPGGHQEDSKETGKARARPRDVRWCQGKFRDVNIQYSIHKITWYNMTLQIPILMNFQAGLRTLERRPFSLSLRCFVLHVADYTPADSLFYFICPDCSVGVQCISKQFNQFRIWVCLTIR